MSTKVPSSPEVVIQATRGFHLVAWRDIYAYRDLLWLLVWRDFVARYKQTALGPIWHIAQPLVTTVIFTVIFSHVAALSTNDLPPTLFYLCGLLAWNYFSQTFTSTSSALVANANLFGKVYFPRLVVPLAGVFSNFISFLIQFVTFLVFLVLYRLGHPAATCGLGWSALLLPLLLVQLACLSLGVGLWLAALTAKFRDFAVLSGFIIQLWMYVTPVIYPLTQVPSQWRLVAAINPVTVPVECFRVMLLGNGYISFHLFAVSIAATVFALFTGLLIFERVEKTFVDIV